MYESEPQLINEVMRSSVSLFSSELYGVRILMRPFVSKIEEGLKSSLKRIEKEHSIRILSQLVCLPRNFSAFKADSGQRAYRDLNEKIVDLSGYIFMTDADQYNMQLILWVYAIYAVDQKNSLMAAQLISNIVINVKHRCQEIAVIKESTIMKIWCADVLAMIDVLNFFAYSFAQEKASDIKANVITWMSTLLSCFCVRLPFSNFFSKLRKPIPRHVGSTCSKTLQSSSTTSSSAFTTGSCFTQLIVR